MKNPWVAVVAIVCLTALEYTALVQKVDGALFSLVTAAIAGIAGFSIKKPVKNVGVGRG